MWLFLKYKTIWNGEKESLPIQSFIRDYFLPGLRKLYEGRRDDVKWFKVLDSFIIITLQFFILCLCAGKKDVYTCWCMPLQCDFSNSQRKTTISR